MDRHRPERAVQADRPEQPGSPTRPGREHDRDPGQEVAAVDRIRDLRGIPLRRVSMGLRSWCRDSLSQLIQEQKLIDPVGAGEEADRLARAQWPAAAAQTVAVEDDPRLRVQAKQLGQLQFWSNRDVALTAGDQHGDLSLRGLWN